MFCFINGLSADSESIVEKFHKLCYFEMKWFDSIYLHELINNLNYQT